MLDLVNWMYFKAGEVTHIINFMDMKKNLISIYFLLLLKVLIKVLFVASKNKDATLHTYIECYIGMCSLADVSS